MSFNQHEKKMKRDLYIDFVKGIATICIIFIHTVFWSGQLYVASEFRLLSLFFDVPIFFVLSGFTSSGNIDKTFQRLIKLHITFMLFVTLLFVLDSLLKLAISNIGGIDAMRYYYTIFGTKYTIPNANDIFNWETLANWWVHQYNNCQSFPVVMGSFWYLKTYYIVMILSVLILRFFADYVGYFIGLLLALTLYFNFVTYPSGQVGYVAYYLVVFLIANQLKEKKIKAIFIPMLYLAVAACFVFMFSYYGKDILLTINKQKFPPKIPYITVSLFAIVTVMSLYNRTKIMNDNFVCNIGRNAIFYYFAQGISSSLVYLVVAPLKETPYKVALMITVFLLNILLAIIIATLLKRYDTWGWNMLYQLRSKLLS